jgi:hypothetical protein
MLLHLPLQNLDLLVEDGDDREQRPDRGRVGGCQRGGLAELLAAQGAQDPGGPLGDVAAPGALEDGADLRAGQPRGPGGLGCPAEQFQRVRGVEVVEGLQRGGEVLQQLMPRPLHLPGPLPDHRLVSPGQDFDALRFR